MKKCTKCKIEKELSCFHANVKYHGNYTTQCKECNSSIRRSRYENNKLKELLVNKQRNDLNKEQRKEKYLNNKDKIKI
jgi:hypothetical protein